MTKDQDGKSPPHPQRKQLVRFAVVGLVNTGLDVGLLFIFLALGTGVWAGNTLSTGIALGFSFLVNRRFTFSSNGSATRQVAPFLAVTLIGLWLLQPLVIRLTIGLAQGLIDDPWLILLAKGLATVASMTWNYLLYSRVVFKQVDRHRTPDSF